LLEGEEGFGDRGHGENSKRKTQNSKPWGRAVAGIVGANRGVRRPVRWEAGDRVESRIDWR
jgi:hypothetical protein